LNPAGGWETKLWQAEKFGELADRLWTENRLFSIVTTAPNETDLAGRVLRANKTGRIFHAAPGLKGFYELAKRAKIYVGGDTGPTHLAVAAGAPVVGIFGPTEWWFNGSPNPSDICVERTDLECRTNCNRRKIGSWKKGECGNWLCLDIAVETVFDAVRARLKTAL
jgi:ADP-heptose:LPS heptosyltransferase